MRFRCPRCQTGYELPLSALPVPGDEKTPYRLKCVRCKCIFIMTVALASPDEADSADKDVYFELISPESVSDSDSVQIESSDTPREDGTKRLRFEFRPAASDAVDTGPTVSKAGAWKKENTLELSEYAIGSFHRAARRKAVVAGASTFVLFGFIIYVAAMNHWSISLNRVDRDIKRAFFLQSEAEIKADLLEQLDITLGRGYTLRTKNRKTVGVIQGEIQNNSRKDLANILLEGRILDAEKIVVSSVTVPCGVKLTDRRLRKVRHGRIPRLYKKKGQPANCTIKSGYSTNFKVVFHQLPKHFNSTYIFEVVPHSVSTVH